MRVSAPLTLHAALLAALVVHSAAYDCAAPAAVPTTSSTGDLKLRQVQVFTRHGDRTPIHPLPGTGVGATWDCNLTFASIFDSDPAADSRPVARLFRKAYLDGRNTLKGNCTAGQLTYEGHMQHLRLGEALRERYVTQLGFVPAEFDSDFVYLRSTDVPRTIQSAQSLVMGLFPTAAAQSAVPVLTIHTMDESEDNMTPNSDLCPRLAELEKAALLSPELNATVQPYLPTLKAVAEKFGLKDADVTTLLQLSDTGICMYCHQFPLPNGLTWDELSSLRTVLALVNQFMLNSTETRSLSMGTLVGEVLDTMAASISGPSAPGFKLYSGHDTTIMPLMNALRAPTAETGNPPYASHVEFELWQAQDESYFVAVAHNGHYVSLPPCGGTLCPWEAFQSAYSTLVPSNYKAACAVSAQSTQEELPHLHLRA